MGCVPPSNFTLSILVKLLGRSRRLNQAFDMVEDVAKEHGFRPNIHVYTCLIQACIHNRQLGRALALHDTLIEEGCLPDEKTYSVLVRGCMQPGALQKAAQVVRCAYRLSKHYMAVPRRDHRHPGVDMRVLEELIMKLNCGSRVEVDTA